MEIFWMLSSKTLEAKLFLGAALDIKDSKRLANNLSPFLKEILEIWSELNYQGSIKCVPKCARTKA